MIKKWIAKAVVQKIISVFPNRERINYWFQKHVTKGVLLTDDYFELKLGHARDHIAYQHRFGRTAPAETTVVELGTGWYPIVPIALYLSGYQAVTSIDTQRWLNHASMLTTLRKFVEWHQAGTLEAYLPGLLPDRWESLIHATQAADDLALEELNNRLNCTFLIADARALATPNSSVEFICSNNTFEHIPEVILKDIIKEFQRILKPSGTMSHFVDLSDHFAHFDPSINIYNFLRYGEATWARIDNRIQPQNRLRWPAYLKMYRDLAIEVQHEDVRPGEPSLLSKVPVHEEFAQYTAEELAVSHGYIISSK